MTLPRKDVVSTVPARLTGFVAGRRLSLSRQASGEQGDDQKDCAMWTHGGSRFVPALWSRVTLLIHGLDPILRGRPGGIRVEHGGNGRTQLRLARYTR